MFSKRWIIFGSIAVFSIILLLVLGVTGVGNKPVTTVSAITENKTTSSSPAGAYSRQQNQSETNVTTTATNSQNNTSVNATAVPTKSEWDNWTTFELFEKYPYLENLTSSTRNNTSTAAVDNTTGSNKSSLEQNQTNTSSVSPANTTRSIPEARSAQEYANQTSVSNTTTPANNHGALINNNVNIDIYNNTGVQNGREAISGSPNSDVLAHLQNSINSLNQSVAQLGKQVTNLNATITIDNSERGKTSTSATNSAESRLANFAMSKRITGDLQKDDYIILGHFANQSDSQISRQVQLKVPCDNDKEPKVKLFAGSISGGLETLDLGKAIDTAHVRGGHDITLSKSGGYCLYQVDLPRDAADAILVNDSGGTLKLDSTRSYVTITGVISQTNY